MASLNQRLTHRCICGHQGGSHRARDAGTHISLTSCTKCDCPGFRRVTASNAGAKRRHTHGDYIKSGFRRL
jgi:hypothetical protein